MARASSAIRKAETEDVGIRSRKKRPARAFPPRVKDPGWRMLEEAGCATKPVSSLWRSAVGKVRPLTAKLPT